MGVNLTGCEKVYEFMAYRCTVLRNNLALPVRTKTDSVMNSKRDQDEPNVIL